MGWLFKSKEEKKKKLEREEVAKDRKEKQEEKIRLDIKKISRYLLTSSAEAYASSVGKELSDFELRSVDAGDVLERDNSLEWAVFEIQKGMAKVAKDLGAEVVVDVRTSISYHDSHDKPIYMMGTALVPKESDSKDKK